MGYRTPSQCQAARLGHHRLPESRKQTFISPLRTSKYGQKRALESIKWIRLLFNRIKEMADGRNWDYDFLDCGGEGDMDEEFTDLIEEEFNR